MNKNPLESAKRNYFIIGSVLTFFVVGGMTLYAKTGGEGHTLSQFLGFEQEVEIEHGVVTTSTKLHSGDDSRGGSDDSSSNDDEGLEYETEVEHGVTTIVAKPHGGDDSDDDGEHRGRGGDDDDEDGDDDRRSGQSSGGSVGSVAPTPVVTSPAPVAPSAKTFTLAEVSTHANAQSCYTTVSGSVYDVTTYIPVHKGGSAAILAICGKDGSSLFAGQHAGEPKPEQMLASFKIGTLAQ